VCFYKQHCFLAYTLKLLHPKALPAQTHQQTTQGVTAQAENKLIQGKVSTLWQNWPHKADRGP
jgi:hypothetical protein